MFKKILVAIDLTESEMTKQAIDKAAALARAFNSELRLVNVQTLIPIAFLDYVKGNFDKDIRQGLEKEIAALAASIDHPTGRISTVVLFGPVYQKVLAEAEEWGAEVSRRRLPPARNGSVSHWLQRRRHRTPRKVLSARRAAVASSPQPSWRGRFNVAGSSLSGLFH